MPQTRCFDVTPSRSEDGITPVGDSSAAVMMIGWNSGDEPRNCDAMRRANGDGGVYSSAFAMVAFTHRDMHRLTLLPLALGPRGCRQEGRVVDAGAYS